MLRPRHRRRARLRAGRRACELHPRRAGGRHDAVGRQPEAEAAGDAARPASDRAHAALGAADRATAPPSSSARATCWPRMTAPRRRSETARAAPDHRHSAITSPDRTSHRLLARISWLRRRPASRRTHRPFERAARRVRRRRFDAVVVRRERHHRGGESAARGRVRLVRRARLSAQPGDRLRLAMLAAPCGVRAQAIRALDKAKIEWVEAFTGGGVAASPPPSTPGWRSRRWRAASPRPA